MLDRQRVRTFLLGGLAGVVAGMLFAPRSGKETRGHLATGAGDARERGREALWGTRERLEERVAARRYRLPTEGRTAAPRGAADGAPTEEVPANLRGAAGASGPPTTPPDAHPHLRGVPRRPEGGPSAEDVPGEGTPDPEELRRRISETRSRLRARLERGESGGDGPGGAQSDGSTGSGREDG